MSAVAIIIPCYNEANRLDVAALIEWANRNTTYQLFLVNDGSTDETSQILSTLSNKHPDQIHNIEVVKNKGKGEAIRAGLQQALKNDFQYIGYLDADLSTPLYEFDRLIQVIQKKDVMAVLGSRIKKADTVIKRSGFRHFVGRIIATIIDLKFNLSIYDTQCGAKLFDATILKDVIKEPFLTRWFFDVELILRLKKIKPFKIHEEPLLIWQDRTSSNLNVFSFPLIFKELTTLLLKY